MNKPSCSRFEYKYAVSLAAAASLEARLSRLLHPDRNAERGAYFIRSLYFDDAAASAYYDKLAGTPERRKYRLRYYNLDPSYIVFECKQKQGDMIRKTSVRVTRALASAMIAGEPMPLDEATEPLIVLFEAERAGSLLRPKVIVDYDRTAFTYPAGNVRITFDRNVRSGLFRTDAFFDPLACLPVLPGGEAILEVKFDRFLPPFLTSALSGIPAVHVASSKYCACVTPGEI